METKEEALRNVQDNLDPAADFEEIEGEELPEFGEFVKFDNIGESLTGLFEGSRKHVGQFGEQIVHDVRAQEMLYTVTGNADLNPKMAKVRKGAFVRITYIEDKEMGRSDLSAMKIYRVEVSKSQRGGPLKQSPLRKG